MLLFVLINHMFKIWKSVNEITTYFRCLDISVKTFRMFDYEIYMHRVFYPHYMYYGINCVGLDLTGGFKIYAKPIYTFNFWNSWPPHRLGCMVYYQINNKKTIFPRKINKYLKNTKFQNLELFLQHIKLQLI